MNGRCAGGPKALCSDARGGWPEARDPELGGDKEGRYKDYKNEWLRVSLTTIVNTSGPHALKLCADTRYVIAYFVGEIKKGIPCYVLTLRGVGSMTAE